MKKVAIDMGKALDALPESPEKQNALQAWQEYKNVTGPMLEKLVEYQQRELHALRIAAIRKKGKR
jgi:hypothetical protein